MHTQPCTIVYFRVFWRTYVVLKVGEQIALKHHGKRLDGLTSWGAVPVICAQATSSWRSRPASIYVAVELSIADALR